MGKKSYHTGQRRVVLPNDSHDVFVPPHLENDPLNEPDREALAAKKEAPPQGPPGSTAEEEKGSAETDLGPAPPYRLYLYGPRRLRHLALPAPGAGLFRDDHRRWQREHVL